MRRYESLNQESAGYVTINYEQKKQIGSRQQYTSAVGSKRCSPRHGTALDAAHPTSNTTKYESKGYQLRRRKRRRSVEQWKRQWTSWSQLTL